MTVSYKRPSKSDNERIFRFCDSSDGPDPVLAYGYLFPRRGGSVTLPDPCTIQSGKLTIDVLAKLRGNKHFEEVPATETTEPSRQKRRVD